MDKNLIKETCPTITQSCRYIYIYIYINLHEYQLCRNCKRQYARRGRKLLWNSNELSQSCASKLLDTWMLMYWLAYCWWCTNPANQLRLVVYQFIPLFTGKQYMLAGCLGFLNHQQYYDYRVSAEFSGMNNFMYTWELPSLYVGRLPKGKWRG